MRIRFTARALFEYEALEAYLKEHSVQGAHHVLFRIDNTINLLAAGMLSGSPTDHADVRMAPVSKYPYVIFFRKIDDTIEVHSVWHTARGRGRLAS